MAYKYGIRIWRMYMAYECGAKTFVFVTHSKCQKSCKIKGFCPKIEAKTECAQTKHDFTDKSSNRGTQWKETKSETKAQRQ